MVNGRETPVSDDRGPVMDAPVATIRFVIASDLKRRLDAIAAMCGLTYEDMVSEALRVWLNAEEDGAV